MSALLFLIANVGIPCAPADIMGKCQTNDVRIVFSTAILQPPETVILHGSCVYIAERRSINLKLLNLIDCWDKFLMVLSEDRPRKTCLSVWTEHVLKTAVFSRMG